MTARCAANNVATADLNEEGGAMQLLRTPLAFVVLGGLTGCYPPTPSTYAPLPAEQPQALHSPYPPAGPAASFLPPPATLRPCTVCNQTRTVVYVGWYP